MAIASQTYVLPQGIEAFGSTKRVIVDIVTSGTYATDGYEILPATLGLSQFYDVAVTVKSPASTEFIPIFNHTTNKLMLFGSNGAAPAALVETANATAVAKTYRVIATGI
jgi:hypothetical protein